MHESHQTPFPSMWRVRSDDETNFTHTCYFCGAYSMATFIEGWLKIRGNMVHNNLLIFLCMVAQ